MGLIFFIIAALIVAGVLARFTRLSPPTQNPCHGNCNQGRNCDCAVAKTDPNWPFPSANRP